MANNPAYNPNLRNPLVFNPKMSANAEILKLLLEEGWKENHAQSLQMLSGNYYSSPDFAQKTQSYAEALQLLANNQGNIVNYEPTSNWKMSDRWYQDKA